MLNVMIDLETLGTSAGCSILAIGAVAFDGAAFYAVAGRRSCLNAGLHEDPDTVAWWDRQDAEAKVVLAAADDSALSVPLGELLVHFSAWLPDDRSSFVVWGNGADFDLPILAEAYRRCGLVVPWLPYHGRCYRTLKNLRPGVKMVKSGVQHNALDDARQQAAHAKELLNALGELA